MKEGKDMKKKGMWLGLMGVGVVLSIFTFSAGVSASASTASICF
jgi:hypothetical protein